MLANPSIIQLYNVLLYHATIRFQCCVLHPFLLSSRSSLLWSRVPHSSAIRWRITTNQVGEHILSSLLGGCFSLRSFVLGGSIVSTAETLSESSQLTGLVELHVSQGLLARLPQESVSRILGRTVERLGGGGARSVGRPVGELDELGECVWPAGAVDVCRVADLLVAV